MRHPARHTTKPSPPSPHPLPPPHKLHSRSRSQDRNFYGQFSGGIRYVDVRAVWYNVTSEWHTHHGVVLGNPLAFLLNDTAAFLRDNPGEVVVLEVSHLNADEATHELLAQEIEHYLGPYLYPRAPAFTETLADMVRLHHRAMVTIEDDAVLAKHPLLWPGETIINSYANSDNLTTMEAYNVEKVDEFLQHNRTYPGQLFKMSWTLTPNEDTVLRMLLPDHPKTLIELADTASKALAPWAAAQATAHNHLYPLLGNILIIDHFETSDIPSVVAPPQALQ